jgi:hypothetical protein
MELAVLIIGVLLGYLLYRLAAGRAKTTGPNGSKKSPIAIKVRRVESGGWAWALHSLDRELPLSEGRADSEAEARAEAAKAWARTQDS